MFLQEEGKLLTEESCSESQIIKVFIQKQQECIWQGKYELKETYSFMWVKEFIDI